MLPKFDYIKPASIKETVDFLNCHGKESKILAGGTDLLVLMRAGASRPRYVVDIKGIRELKMMEYDRVKGLSIGATVTLNEVLESRIVKKHHPLLCESACLHSDSEIRNRATVTGNICNALPSADSTPPLMVLDAVAILASSRGVRRVRIRNFFVGIRKTVIRYDELLKEVEVPPLQANSGTAFLKIGRTAEDLALVNVAVRITVDDHNVCRGAEIAIGGGIGPTLVRTEKACALLEGNRPVDDLIAKVAFLSSEELVPRSGSFRGSPQYKKALAKILVRRALKLAIARAQGTCHANMEV
jgi:carbon-monoxide dehydrogenase medium subunit